MTKKNPEDDTIRYQDQDPGGSTEPLDVLADLEATLNEVADANPRVDVENTDPTRNANDLKALLEVSLAINSSLVLDDVLQIVMHKAIELMQAERGLIMLLDDGGVLQFRSAYNLCKEEMMEENFHVSNSITSEVANTGRSVYTSDAQEDQRFSKQESIVELHLRSIMCVPIKLKDEVIGVIYLDNSSQSKMFLKSDLFLFELYAQMVSNALHNASIYDSLLHMKTYNESVISKSPIGTVVIDSHGRICTINAIALEIFDFNKGAVVLAGEDGQATMFLDLLPASERGRWKNMIDVALTSQTDHSDSRYFHNTGYIEKALSLKISPISKLPQDGNGVILAVEDITEKVVMEKYVILSEKLVAKGEMAASIAHELNNYLAITANNAELMSLNIDREQFDKVKFNAKAITENVFKIKRFVDSLMDFSHPEAEFISYDLLHLIEDLLFSLRVQPRFKKVHFTIDLDPEMPNLEMDVGQIQQVLLNLLNNSADAITERMEKEGVDPKTFKREISIRGSFSLEDENATIEISDNGLGMSEETRQKIFNLHFTTKKTGHGLGLANCKKIIEQHNGTLNCDSELGAGTTFKLVLPRFHPVTQESTV